MNYIIIKIGLELGLITRDEILSFSENEYNNTNDDIYLDIISLNTTSNLNKFLEVLNNYSTDVSNEDFNKFNQIFIFFILKEKDWFKIELLIIRYYHFFKIYLDEDNFEFWSRMQDDYELRNNGFSGCMNMPLEMMLYLNKFIINKYYGSFFENIIKTLKHS